LIAKLRSRSRGSSFAALEGGSGGDTLTGNGARNFLYGGPGGDRLTAGGDADTLSGGSGGDALSGGDDGDTLDGGSGADTLRGEAGEDTVSYDDQVGPVTVSLDGQANDGAAGEGDDIGPDFEKVFGSFGDDTITGGPGNEELTGGSGSDRIDGGGGADKIRGNAGDDVIKGGAGNDELRGNAGDDTIDAGAGEDVVSGQDREDGGEDVDTLELRDNEKDIAACTGGITRAFADHLDVVAATCLTERTAPPGGTSTPPPVAGPPPAPTGPALRVPRQGIKVDRRGVARIRVTCPKGTAPCAGVLRLVAVSRNKPVIVGTIVYAIPGGKARTLRVRLNRRGRSLFRARRWVMRVDVTVAARAKGAPQSKVQAVRLRRG
jgi:Ca2+-binding RTX toxin-like protein